MQYTLVFASVTAVPKPGVISDTKYSFFFSDVLKKMLYIDHAVPLS